VQPTPKLATELCNRCSARERDELVNLSKLLQTLVHHTGKECRGASSFEPELMAVLTRAQNADQTFRLTTALGFALALQLRWTVTTAAQREQKDYLHDPLLGRRLSMAKQGTLAR